MQGCCELMYPQQRHRNGSFGSTLHSLSMVILFFQSHITWCSFAISSCHSCHSCAFAVIAVGAESLEVSQQMDDDAAVSQSSEISDFIIVDAFVTFVSQQDYIAAAPQMHALLNVCNARKAASLHAPFLTNWVGRLTCNNLKQGLRR